MTDPLSLLIAATVVALVISFICSQVAPLLAPEDYRDEDRRYEVDATAEQYLASRDWQI